MNINIILQKICLFLRRKQKYKNIDRNIVEIMNLSIEIISMYSTHFFTYSILLPYIKLY